jgi:hypothetical protein
MKNTSSTKSLALEKLFFLSLCLLPPHQCYPPLSSIVLTKKHEKHPKRYHRHRHSQLSQSKCLP